MAWWYAVVESRHDLQNPTSSEKILLLGERLGLAAPSHVLDVAAGRGGPAILLARELGCRLRCVEQAHEFAAAARRRVEEAGLSEQVEIVEADAAAADLGGGYDAALCLGASFVWGGLVPTLRALVPTVKPGGFVAVGEPYWRSWPLPAGFEPGPEEDFVTLAGTVARAESAGVSVVTTIVSSEDDWDRYESLRWLTLDDWLRDHPDHPDAAAFRERGRRLRDRYLRWERDLLGWAILVCRT